MNQIKIEVHPTYTIIFVLHFEYKITAMPSPIVFCRKEAEEIIKMLPDNLDITYSDQNNAV